MKKIFIITGKTGAGKTTLCEKLGDYFEYPILSFSDMRKEFAYVNGYKRIRDCYLAMELNDFKTTISEHFLKIIKERLNTNDVIIIDGLYIDEVAKTLMENYNVKIIYLKADDYIRYKRISQKLSITIENAKIENDEKERLKNEVGIETLIKNADIIIDGNKSQYEVFNMTKFFIKES